MALIKSKINALNKKPETNRDNFVRINGWTYPLHSLQIIAWIFYLLMSLVCFAFIVPTLPNTQLRLIVLSIKLALFIAHFIAHLIAVNINPADDNVVDKLELRKQRPTRFDRSKHSHVIENQFCYICETSVGSKSKHCSVCNKCVSNFDHHCKWLNNCVGGKNYRWFIYCVLSALIGSVIVFLNCLILTIAYFSPHSWLYDSTSTLLYFNIESNVSQGLQIFWIVVIISSLILSLIVILLLTHLLGFHLFLNCIGLSTYEFVVKQRKEKTYISNLLNRSERNKLYSYLAQLQNCIGIVICTKNRIKPSDPDITDLSQSKLSNDNKLIETVINGVSDKHIKQNSENTNSYQISNIENKVEKSGREVDESQTNESVSESNSQLQNEVKLNRINAKTLLKPLPQINENLKNDENSNQNNSIEEQNEESFPPIGSDLDQIPDHIRTKTSQPLNNQPIFMPLNPSFGQNGRTSRLSFTQNDFLVPSVSPEFRFPSVPFNRYNTYNKLIANNVRLNPLNGNLNRINKNRFNRINKLEFESNNTNSIQM